MMTHEPPIGSHFEQTLKLLGNGHSEKTDSDFTEFQNRLKTFLLGQKWVGKPSALSPPTCARFGWKCCTPNKLQCVSCSAILFTSLPDIEKFTSYDKCVSGIVSSLKSSHKKHCPWPLAPSPENFCVMVPVHKEVAFKIFASYLESLLPIESFLPEVKDSVSVALELSEECFKALYELSHIPDSPAMKSAILLAATGWKVVPSDGKKYITCVHCQRTVGIWFYSSVHSKPREDCTPKEERTNKLQYPVDASSQSTQEDGDPTTNIDSTDHCDDKSSSIPSAVQNTEETVTCKEESSDISETPNHLHVERLRSDDNSRPDDNAFISEGEAPSKKRKLSLDMNEPFDALYEHRPWCKWLSRTIPRGSDQSSQDSQGSSKGVPGYKVFIECLLKNVRNSTPSPSSSSPTKEHLNKAIELLMTWSSPV